MKRNIVLEIAQEKLELAIRLLEIACKGDRNAEVYLIDHLRIKASENHGFATRELNIDQLIARYAENGTALDDVEVGMLLEDEDEY